MTKIIYYRTVVNDAVCHAWEAMPEVQPPTVTGLIAYLKGPCGIDPAPLEIAWSFEDVLLQYGNHRQFKMPEYPTVEEFKLMVAMNKIITGLACPICGGELTPSYNITAGMHENNHTMECPVCQISFGVLSGHAWTSNEIAETITRAVEKAKS